MLNTSVVSVFDTKLPHSDKLMYSSLVLLSNHSCVLFGGRGSPSQVNNRCYLLTSVDGKRISYGRGHFKFEVMDP